MDRIKTLILLSTILFFGSLIFLKGGKVFFGEPFYLIFTGLIAFLFWRLVTKEKKYVKNSLNPFILFYFLLQIFLILFSQEKTNSINSFLYLFSGLFVFFIFSNLKLSKNEIKKSLKVLFYLSLLVIFLGFYYFFKGQDSRLGWSLFDNPNVFAGFLLFFLPISFHFASLEKEKKFFFKTFFGLTLLAFLLTFSRGGLLVLLITLPFYIFSFREEKKNEVKTLALILITLVAFLTTLYFGVLKNSLNLDRIILGDSLNIRARIEFIKTGLAIFKDYWLTGSGLGTYSTVLPLYQISPVGYSAYPHNYFIELLAENGIFSLVFFGFIIFVFYKFLREKEKGNLEKFIFIGIVGSFLHNLIEVDWHWPVNFFLFWFFMGLISSELFRKRFLTLKIEVLSSIILIISVLLISFGTKLFFKNYYFEWGDHFLELEKFEEAKKNFEKSLRFGKSSELFLKTAFTYYATSNVEEDGFRKAKNYATYSLAKNNFNSLSYQLLGKIYLKENNLEAAQRNFEKAISLDKFNNPEYYIDLSNVYILKGDREAAKKKLEEVLSYYPNEILNYRTTSKFLIEKISQVHLFYALILEEENKIDAAKNHLIEAIKIDRENSEAIRMLNKIQDGK